MGRIRTVKPDFFTSEDSVSLPPLARLLYIALWCESDRRGRFVYKPMTIKYRYFPADDCDIYDLFDALATRGLIVRYECENVEYAYIPTFESHQQINPRESESALPEPPSDKRVSGSRKLRVSHASHTRDERVTDAQTGKEGKGKERKGKDIVSNWGKGGGETSKNEEPSPVPVATAQPLGSSASHSGSGESETKRQTYAAKGTVKGELRKPPSKPPADDDTDGERQRQLAKLRGNA